MLLLLSLACTGAVADKTLTYDSGDSGTPECGRVRGTAGILMFQADDAVRAPVDAAESDTDSHSVAGPLSDGLTWMLSYGPEIQVSTDAGCNWDRVGNLPATGWWNLVAAGDRVYAFDRDSGDAARTDDVGVSWTPFDAGEPFVGWPVVDAGDPNRLRGVQARGVVTTSDGGESWQITGTAPAGTLRDASLVPTDLDTIAVATTTGLAYTRGGGATWTEIGANLPSSKGSTGYTVTRVAVHPENVDVLWARSQDSNGTTFVSRTEDHGGDWSQQASSEGSHLDEQSGLWPVPGRTDQVISSYASGVDSYGLDLHTITVGVGTHTLHVGTYFSFNHLVIGPDRWIAAVDGVVE